MKLLIKISYDGSAYCGWQIQPNGATIQGKICEAAKKIFGCECDVTGCSRTDSGVHAKAFCAAVTERFCGCLNTSIATSKIPHAFCSYLPDDIAVTDACMVDDDFHPRYDVVSKEYIYRIYNGPIRSPFEKMRSFHYPIYIDDESLTRMNKAAECFIGNHDFTSFMAQGSKITDAVRTVFKSELYRESDNRDVIVFKVSANGFLYNMVRIMTGTLLDVFHDKLNEKEILNIIEARDRNFAGRTMPPYGLYLNNVTYRKNYFITDK